MPTPKAILFDLDGTLADTAYDLGTAANHLRIQRQLPPMELEAFRPYASHGARGLIQAALSMDSTHSDYETCQTQFLDYYANHLCHHTTWFEGIPELIHELESAHIAWGIVTNKHSRFGALLIPQIQPTLRPGCLIYGDTTPHAKPHPEPLLEAARRLKHVPQDCWYVGDAERDITAANSAGMRSIVAGYGYISDQDRPNSWGGHHMCDTVSQLRTLLRQSA